MREFPEQVRAYVVKEVAALCKEMDMKKTVASDDELNFVCRTIIEDFPAMKIEELRLAFDEIRKGKIDLYERLKAPEICKALYEYEGRVRAPILERINTQGKKAELPNREVWMKVAEALPDEDDKGMRGEGIGTRLKRSLQ